MATSNARGGSGEDMRLKEVNAALDDLAPLLNRLLGSVPNESSPIDRNIVVRASNALDRYRSLDVTTQSDKANKASQSNRRAKGVQEGAIPIDTFEVILDFCALPDIIAVGQASKNLRGYVSDYLSRSLNRFLGRWVNDQMAFREMMKITNAIISGSAALSFISRDGSWQPKDLDLYVPRGGANYLIQYLEQEGYELLPDEIEEESNYVGVESAQGILDVYKLARNPTSSSNTLSDSIDIIESISSTPVLPILHYHTTVVMNWISPHRIMVLYPKLTFSKRGIVHRGGGRSAKGRTKYAERGFAIHSDSMSLGASCGEACSCLIRTTSDSGVMEVFLGSRTEDQGASEEGELFWLTGSAWTWAVRPRLRPGGCPNPKCPRYTPLLEGFLPTRESGFGARGSRLEVKDDLMEVDN